MGPAHLIVEMAEGALLTDCAGQPINCASGYIYVSLRFYDEEDCSGVYQDADCSIPITVVAGVVTGSRDWNGVDNPMPPWYADVAYQVVLSPYTDLSGRTYDGDVQFCTTADGTELPNNIIDVSGPDVTACQTGENTFTFVVEGWDDQAEPLGSLVCGYLYRDGGTPWVGQTVTVRNNAGLGIPMTALTDSLGFWESPIFTPLNPRIYYTNIEGWAGVAFIPRSPLVVADCCARGLTLTCDTSTVTVQTCGDTPEAEWMLTLYKYATDGTTPVSFQTVGGIATTPQIPCIATWDNYEYCVPVNSTLNLYSLDSRATSHEYSAELVRLCGGGYEGCSWENLTVDVWAAITGSVLTCGAGEAGHVVSYGGFSDTTDSSGNYVLCVDPRVQDADWVTCEGHTNGWDHWQDGEAYVYDFEFGGKIEGYVTDCDTQELLAGATVQVWNGEAEPDVLVETLVANASGYYLTACLSEEIYYYLIASASGYSSATTGMIQPDWYDSDPDGPDRLDVCLIGTEILNLLAVDVDIVPGVDPAVVFQTFDNPNTIYGVNYLRGEGDYPAGPTRAVITGGRWPSTWITHFGAQELIYEWNGAVYWTSREVGVSWRELQAETNHNQVTTGTYPRAAYERGSDSVFLVYQSDGKLYFRRSQRISGVRPFLGRHRWGAAVELAASVGEHLPSILLQPQKQGFYLYILYVDATNTFRALRSTDGGQSFSTVTIGAGMGTEFRAIAWKQHPQGVAIAFDTANSRFLSYNLNFAGETGLTNVTLQSIATVLESASNQSPALFQEESGEFMIFYVKADNTLGLLASKDLLQTWTEING